MPAPPIDQKISLTGDKEVKEQLAALGTEGAAALKALEDAASKGGTSLASTFKSISAAVAPIKKSIGEVGESFKQLGEAATHFGERILALVAAEGIAGIAVVELAKGAAETADHLKDIQQELGISAALFQKFGDAAARTGDNVDDAERALSRLAASVSDTADKQKEAFVNILQTITDKTTATGVQIIGRSSQVQGKIIGGWVDVAGSVDKVLPHLITLAKASGDVRGPDQLRLAIIDIASKTDDAGAKMREFIRAAGSATPALTLFEKFGTSLEKGQTALQKLGIDALDASNKTRSLDSLLPEIANKLDAISNTTDRAKIAIDLFGRSGVKLLPVLHEFAAGSQEAAQQLELLQLHMTSADLELGDKFSGTITLFSRALKGVKDQIGLAFIPVLEPAFAELTDLLVENVGRVRDLAKTIADELAPAIKAFRDQLNTPAQQENIFSGLQQTVKDISTGVKETAPIIGGAFRSVQFVLRGIADAINFVFGTNLNATSIAALLVIGKITGAFRLLAAAVRTASTIIGIFGEAIAGAFASGGVAAVAALALEWSALGAIILGVANILLNWDTYSKGVIAFFGGLGELATAVAKVTVDALIPNGAVLIVEGFKTAIATIEDFFSGLVDWVSGTATGIINLLKPAWDFVQSLISAIGNVTSAIGQAPGMVPGGFASGGAVVGPGGPTSDSIIARLSAGEYVVKAASVGKYGIGFLDALNQGRLAFSALGSQLRGFAAGGLVSVAPRGGLFGSASPGPGGGGLFGGRMPVNLHIGVESFPLFGDELMVARMVKAARKHGIIRAGKMPSWSQ